MRAAPRFRAGSGCLDVVTDLCDQLRSAGVPALHFYTMNQSAATLEICRRLEL